MKTPTQRARSYLAILVQTSGVSTCDSSLYALLFGLIPTTSPSNKQSLFNRLSVQTFEKPKSQKKKTTKAPHIAAVSVNMISRRRDLFRSRSRRRKVHIPSVSSPHSDYRPGSGQVLVDKEGARRYSLWGSNTLQLWTTFFLNRGCITSTIETLLPMVL